MVGWTGFFPRDIVGKESICHRDCSKKQCGGLEKSTVAIGANGRVEMQEIEQHVEICKNFA